VAMQARDKQGALWIPEGATGVGARGDSAAIETTALAIQALLLEGGHPGLVERALQRLIAWRGKDGRFGTTQSTILALEALIAAEAGSARPGDIRVTVDAPEAAAATRVVAADSTEPERVDLGANVGPIRVEAEGKGRLRATLARTSWVPWQGPVEPASRRLALTVTWPEESVRVGEPSQALVEIRNPTSDKPASVVTVEVGIPPAAPSSRKT